MDGAWLGSVDIAIRKARTARLFDMSTGEIGELSQPGKPLYGIEHSNGGLITFPGGVPLKDASGTVIGAIGVSGSSVENDHAVAAAGADALLRTGRDRGVAARAGRSKRGKTVEILRRCVAAGSRRSGTSKTLAVTSLRMTSD